jgi:hypothetical protein
MHEVRIAATVGVGSGITGSSCGALLVGVSPALEPHAARVRLRSSFWMPALAFSRQRRAAYVREVIGVAMLACSGCEVASIDVERAGNAVIPHDGTLELMGLDGFEAVLGEIEDTEDVRRQDISDATLDQLVIEVLDPGQPDLSFITRIEVFAQSPELERVRVAHGEDFPVGARVVALEIDDVELRDYVAAQHVSLVASIDGERPARDVHVHAVAQLSVGVTLRGACHHAK